MNVSRRSRTVIAIRVIRFRRNRQNLSRIKFAAKCGVPVWRLAAIEEVRGDYHAPTARSIAAVIKADGGDLFKKFRRFQTVDMID